MYSSGAVVLAEGLAEGSSIVLARLQEGPFMAYMGDFPGGQRFPEPAGLRGEAALGRLEDAVLILDNSSVEVRVFSISDPSLLGLVSGPTRGEAWLSSGLVSGAGLAMGSVISLSVAGGLLQLNLSRVLSAPVSLPDTWIMVSEADLAASASADVYDFILLRDRTDALRLQAQGFTVLSLSSAVDFFHRAMEEARGIVLGIVAVSSAAVSALAFTLLSLEVRYRRREMTTLRALGMDLWGFAGLYGTQLAFIVVAGTTLGIAMGIVAANALVSFAPFFGLATIIRPQVTLQGLVLPLLSALLSGLAGGALAIVMTTRRISRAHGD